MILGCWTVAQLVVLLCQNETLTNLLFIIPWWSTIAQFHPFHVDVSMQVSGGVIGAYWLLHEPVLPWIAVCLSNELLEWSPKRFKSLVVTVDHWLLVLFCLFLGWELKCKDGCSGTYLVKNSSQDSQRNLVYNMTS